jgi:hypothetical protein
MKIHEETSWVLQVASAGRVAAHKIIESDLEQTAMILTTLVAAVTYGWIEGFAIKTTTYEATQIWWILGHFSTYSAAMGILFACITGGFSLIKGRNMFKHGKRYFLITFVGNYPFSWLVEDFAFFWFYPDFRLNDTAWTNWALGGFWLLDPWRSGVKIWIPNWYWITLVFWICMMWYAHRCTVYDNLVKDEIAREILPETIKIPQVEVNKVNEVKLLEPVPVAPKVERIPLPRPEAEAEVPPLVPSDERPRHTETPVKESEAKPKARSPEAQAALEKLKKRWTLDATTQTT